MTPTPFKINVSQAKIDLLKQKLALCTFPDELDESGWELGVPLEQIKRLTKYWQEGYDWKVHEKKFNDALPQFMTTVATDEFGELDIHFIHQKSGIEGAIPLIFVHGWPGSFMEVVKLLPQLKGNGIDSPAFDIVAPSLPNYAFSSSVQKRGFGLKQYAEVCHKLMLQLGYPQYGEFFI
jgi:pimeloyl-ACP methyl ester carboxylesterase